MAKKKIRIGLIGCGGNMRNAHIPRLQADGGVELVAQVLPAPGLNRDRDVVQPAQHLGVGAEVEAGEVEEGQQVAVADVEEEVGRPLVVAILEEFGHRKLENPLVEGNGSLDIRRQQRKVMHALG